MDITLLVKNPSLYAEDATPIVGSNFLTVADGLGSGVKHSKVFKQQETLESFVSRGFVKLFIDSEKTKNHIPLSFNSIDLLNEKSSSSYFASNIAALSIMSFVEKNSIDEVFDSFSVSGSSIIGTTKTIEEYLGTLIGNEILKNLKQFADNLTLKDERPQMIASKNHFLPTTLAGCIFREKNSLLEVITFWAGDSRVYMFNQDDGLIPLTKDEEESPGGGLTNIIQILRPFHINCRHSKHPHPLALIAMSDGVFDKKNIDREESSEKCLVQLEFEKELLSLILQSENSGAFSMLASDYYLKNLHDDSASLALKTFGFNDWNDLKDSCRKRKHKVDDMLVCFKGGFNLDAYQHQRALLEKQADDNMKAREKVIDQMLSHVLAIPVKDYIDSSIANRNHIVSKEEISECALSLKKKVFHESTQTEIELISLVKSLIPLISSTWFETKETLRELLLKIDPIKKLLCNVSGAEKKYKMLNHKLIRETSLLEDDISSYKEKTSFFLSYVNDQLQRIQDQNLSQNDLFSYDEFSFFIDELRYYIYISIKSNNPHIKRINSLVCQAKKLSEKDFKAAFMPLGMENPSQALRIIIQAEMIQDQVLLKKIEAALLRHEEEKIKNGILNNPHKKIQSYTTMLIHEIVSLKRETLLQRGGAILPEAKEDLDKLEMKQKNIQEDIKTLDHSLQLYNKYNQSFHQYIKGSFDD